MTAPFVRPAARWLLPSGEPDATRRLQTELGISRVLAQVLASRGFETSESASRFLAPDLTQLHDPYALLGMAAAVARIRAAISRNEPILIYGDYDVDGTTSVVILKKTIEILRGRADFHIPHRVREGYGMRPEAIDAAAAAGIRLIISVDTGIRAAAVVRHAADLGIDVIITDHHLPEAELPPAWAVLNPNRADCSYPCKQLCGAGVTLKLVQALLQSAESMTAARQRALLESFLKPVAIATVADIVPLLGENRVIVRRGLSGLKDVRNHGLRALLRVSGLQGGEAPTAQQVAFRLAPRINAAGRMDTANDVIQLFLTNDAAEAERVAERLDLLNRERQQVEREIIQAIVAQCEERGEHLNSAGLVFAGEDWHVGVLGIVASRLVERFCRPVFVLGRSESADGRLRWTGSGRSIPAFHLLDALESMPGLLERFGGHRGAAGLTLPDEQLQPFRERFHTYAAQHISEEQRRPEYQADAELIAGELTDDLAKELAQLEPFGFGNQAPLLLIRGAEVPGPPRVISEGKHLSVPLRQGGRTFWVKAWNFGDRMQQFSTGSRHDVLCQVEADDYSKQRGYADWCLSAKDFRAAG